ncbi:MAG: hypothetical protein HC851_23960 [Acaryochloris sp. RU_4_1]|nr:hypothetical protein [Acaryochloris sp. RU_4_1]
MAKAQSVPMVRGSATYKGSGSVTTPQGQTYNGSTNGNASYSASNGYSGNSSVTVNGQTYQTSTQNGTTQIMDTKGNTQVHQRPHR